MVVPGFLRVGTRSYMLTSLRDWITASNMDRCRFLPVFVKNGSHRKKHWQNSQRLAISSRKAMKPVARPSEDKLHHSKDYYSHW